MRGARPAARAQALLRGYLLTGQPGYLPLYRTARRGLASNHRYPGWRDLVRMVVAAIAENVGFRQLHAWWRLRGMWNAVRGRHAPWVVPARPVPAGESDAAAWLASPPLSARPPAGEPGKRH